MPVRTKGLVPACLVLATMCVWVCLRPENDRSSGSAPAQSPAAAVAAPTGGPEPHAAARVRPPERKRAEERMSIGPDFLDAIVSPDGQHVTIPLPGGGEAEGRAAKVERDAGGVHVVQGETTRPAGGRFFFQRQTRPGKAGAMVGYLHAEGSDAAWRVVPDPADPRRRSLWEKTSVDQVVCRSFIRAPEEDPEAIPPTHPTDYPIPPEENGIIQLESLPGATAVVYLDFDGENRDFTSWGKIDAAPAAVTNSQIFQVWKGVCEDFQPFELNITTVRAVYDAAPQGSRMQVIVTPTTDAAPGAGGVAYIGSFNWTGEVVCWSFYSTGKNAVEVISHEVGHTLGLRHDGRTSPWEAYYAGGNGWAPIMGVGYSQALSQWSKGEYPNADNHQDDTYLIANTNNDVAWREDDHGAAFGAATWLEVAAGGEVADEGFIGSAGDEDSFRFSTRGGLLTLDVRNVEFNANLNVAAEIVDSSGNVVAASDPSSSSDAWFTDVELDAGDYMIRVTGVGNGNPYGSGFSNYGSLGAYTITGIIPDAAHAERLSIAENSPAGAFVGILPPRADHGSASLSFSILSGDGAGIFAINSLTGAITVADPAPLDFESLSSRWDDPAEFELFIGIADSLGAASETIRVVISVSDENEAPEIEPLAGVTLLERLVPGTFILRATAADPDRGGRLTYSIEDGNFNGSFEIDPETGILTARGNLDFETYPAYSLTIRATDDGSPSLHDETVLHISLVDIAEDLRPGGVERAFYEGIIGNAVASLRAAPNFPHQPDSVVSLGSFDGGVDHGDDYGSTIRGYLVPPVTGDYTFWLASDDWGELWISPDAEPANAVKHAEVIGWTQPRQWDKYPSQRSVTLPLVAGQRYFIEALQKEGGGEDHVAVAWQMPGSSSREVVPGNVLVPLGETHAPWMAPLSVTVRECADAGQRIATLPFVEADGGQGITEVEILEGNEEGLFAIHPFSRDLTVAEGASLVAGSVYQLLVRATDNGVPPMSGTGEVTVRVIGLEEELHAWWKFDEASGHTAFDSSGSGRHAGLEGGAVREARAAADGALCLDGSSGRVEYLGEDALAGTDAFTVAAWVRVPQDHAFEGVVIQQRESGAAGYIGQYQVRIRADGTVNFHVYGRTEDGGNEGFQFDITSATAIHDDTWHHLACVRDGDEGLLYIDGTLAASGSGAPRALDAALSVVIGSDARESDDYLAGAVDDVRIYQDALGSSQVLKLARGPRVALVGPVSGSVGVAPGVGLLLEGAVSDPDGSEPGTSWAQISGPADAVWESVEPTWAAVRFPVPGFYQFRFSASDGEYEASREVTVIAGTTAVSPVAGIDYGDSMGWHDSPAPGAYVLQGLSAGFDEGSGTDAFHGVGQAFSGDFDLRARVDDVTDLVETENERAGLFVRMGDSTDASEAGGYIGMNGNGHARCVSRLVAGEPNVGADLGMVELPVWFRIARQGGEISLFRSNDGIEWTLEQTMSREGVVRAGLCWSSDSDSAGGAAVFSGVSGFCEANVAPVVSAGPVSQVGIAATAVAAGTVTDDGMPTAPGAVSLLWTSVQSGLCEFDSPDQPETGVSASADGEHALRLIADDGDVRSFADTSIEVLPTVTSSVEFAGAAETGPVPGTFRISRDGAFDNDLEVSFAYAGTAEAGVDFTSEPAGTVVIPAGASFAEVSLLPIPDFLVEGAETVELVIANGSHYIDGASAALTIADSNHAPVWLAPSVGFAGAVQDSPYSSSLSAHAVDPDGDAMTFEMISGPAWLAVAADGSVAGTPGRADVGAHVFTVRVIDSGGLSAETGCTLTVYPLVLDFEDWKEVEFGAQAADHVIAGDLADPDHDDRPNLVEYALGTNPNAADASGILVDFATVDGIPYLRIHIPLDPAAADVRPVVEASGDLSDPMSWSTAGTVVEESLPDRLVVRDDVGGPRRFLRLRVSR